MKFNTAVLVMVGFAAVTAIESDDQELLMKLHENLGQDLRPLVSESNNLSTFGFNAYPGQFPYHARLFTTHGEDSFPSISAGSLITPNYILTNAAILRRHMMYDDLRGYADLGIEYGSSADREQQIDYYQSGVQLHPIHDIATVRLDHPVSFTKFVQPIRLPSLSDSRTYEMMEGTHVGGLFESIHSYMRNQVLPNDICDQELPAETINSYHICTNAYIGGISCWELHGSGLTIEDERGRILVGVTSTIYICDLNYPTVFTRVSGLHDWISMNSDYVYDA